MPPHLLLSRKGGGMMMMSLLAASAATKAATSARQGFHLPFDPAGTLGWAVPMILIMPLLTFAMVSGARTRRTATNLATFGLVVTLGLVALVAVAELPKEEVNNQIYSWLNLAVTSSTVAGPPQFQSFAVDVVLRTDHAALLALFAALVISLGVTVWMRVGARDEPGPVRTPAMVVLLTFAAVGVILSGDLIELFAFWGLGGAVSYLVLTQRWGSDAVTRAARAALAVPLITDLAMFAGIAILFSRYGVLAIDKLSGTLLHTTPGWGYRSLTAACILIAIGLAGRMALPPLHAWQAAVAGGPTGPVAMVQGVWPILAGIVFYRLLPVFQGAGPQALIAVMIAGVAAAVLGGVLALASNDIRQVVTASGAALTGLGLATIGAGLTGAGLTGLVAVGAARAALILAVGGLIHSMRTADLSAMGGGLQRFRVTAAAIGFAGLALALALDQVQAVGAGPAWLRAWFGVAMALVGLAALRLFFRVGLGELRRRRAFDPERVRDAPPRMSRSALGLALLGMTAAILSFVPRWLRLVDQARHQEPSLQIVALWLGVAIVGAALSLALYGLRRDLGELVSRRLGGLLGILLRGLVAGPERFLFRPVLAILEGFETVPIGRGSGAVGGSLGAGGQLIRWAVPSLSIGLGAGLILIVVVTLLTRGVAP